MLIDAKVLSDKISELEVKEKCPSVTLGLIPSAESHGKLALQADIDGVLREYPQTEEGRTAFWNDVQRFGLPLSRPEALRGAGDMHDGAKEAAEEEVYFALREWKCEDARQGGQKSYYGCVTAGMYLPSVHAALVSHEEDKFQNARRK